MNLKGKAFLKFGKFKDAIKCFDKVIKFFPKGPEAWYNKGDALQARGKVKDAKKCFDNAVKLDPSIRHPLR